MGINVNRIISLTFLIGGAMGGAAGVLFGVQYGLREFFRHGEDAARAGRWTRPPGVGLSMTIFGDQELKKELARGIDVVPTAADPVVAG